MADCPAPLARIHSNQIADRPMMTVVTVETSHINKVVHDMIKLTFIL